MASVFASSFVGALGWALLHFLWQGALVALLAGVALQALRDARPQLRYLVALAALALCVLLPCAQLLAALPSPAMPAVEARALFATVGEGGEAGMRAWIDAHMAALVAAWLGCVALLSLRLAAGVLWVERLKRTAQASAAPWQARLDALGVRMHVARRIPLLVAAGLDSPVAAGILRPVVLVPAALVTGMPAALLEALLAHELAHVQRHDYLVNLLQGAAEVLLFYHPAVWWLSRRVRIEREQVADDMAAQALGDARRLALALQALAQYQEGEPALAPAARGGNLLARIQRLLLPHARASGWQASVVLPAVALVCAMLAAPAGSSSAAVPQAAAPSTPAAAPAAKEEAALPAKALAAAAMPARPAKPAPAAPAAPAAKALAAVATPATPASAAAPALPLFPVTLAERDANVPPKDAFEVKPPQMLKNSCDDALRPVGASYPGPARALVAINVLVSADGRVSSATVARTGGFAALDEATRRYAASCRYEPGTLGGQPAEVHSLTWFVWNTGAAAAPKPADPELTTAVIDAKQCKKPEYPAEALAQGRTGSVTMEFLVGVDGKVKDGRLFKSSGHRDLDVSALEALKLCQFIPARRKDVAEESWTKMMYVWRLE